MRFRIEKSQGKYSMSLKERWLVAIRFRSSFVYTSLFEAKEYRGRIRTHKGHPCYWWIETWSTLKPDFLSRIGRGYDLVNASYT